MIDRDKVIRALERCSEGTCPSIFSNAYAKCEYKLGDYCRSNKVCMDALALIMEQEEKIKQLNIGIDTLRKKLEETVLGD